MIRFHKTPVISNHVESVVWLLHHGTIKVWHNIYYDINTCNIMLGSKLSRKLPDAAILSAEYQCEKRRCNVYGHWRVIENTMYANGDIVSGQVILTAAWIYYAFVTFLHFSIFYFHISNTERLLFAMFRIHIFCITGSCIHVFSSWEITSKSHTHHSLSLQLMLLRFQLWAPC